MMYVGSQILIWLIIATLFGFAIGWMAKSRKGAQVRKRRRF